MFKYKSILITGGTGSFGQEFIKSILQNHPDVDRVIVFSRDEYKHFHMSNMPEFSDNKKLQYFVGDIRDKDAVMRAFEGVDAVIHAAALKQVPSCEYNPFEAIKTNVIGGQNIIDAAIDKKVKRVVALSTDKACLPVSLYGATKLCSDKLFIAANNYNDNKDTIFSVVRHGNFIGSRGSVIPYFKKLIESGAKELPITNFQMTRFFLTLSSAVDIVLLALNKMNGGEIFIKKAPSMKIVDLAKLMGPNLKLKEVGINPGEKLHEVLISKEDFQYIEDHKNYFVIQPYFTSNKTMTFMPAFLDRDFLGYNSGDNDVWISPQEMSSTIASLKMDY